MESKLSKSERLELAVEMRNVAFSGLNGIRGLKFSRESDRLESCGENAFFYECIEDHKLFYTPITCKSRICDQCCHNYYYKIVDRFNEVVKLTLANKRKGYFASLLTLTVNKSRFGDKMPDREDVKRIYKESSDFFRLFCGRYRGVFTRTGKIRENRKKFIGAGAISCVEVGQDNNNLHIHALVYMPFTPISKMKASWLRITGDSHVLRLDPVKSTKHVVNYLMKYITKLPSTDSLNRLAQYGFMIKGSRRLRSSGMFYNNFAKLVKKLNFCCPDCESQLKLLGAERFTNFADQFACLWTELRKKDMQKVAIKEAIAA